MNFQKIKLEANIPGNVIDIKSGNSGNIYIIDNGKNTIPRKVAFKSIHSEKISTEKEEHFIKECQTWFQTSNNFIATPYFPLVIGKIPFICMPYYEYDLSNLIINNKIDFCSALVLSCQLIKLLLAIKEDGIENHQDFNPQNVLVLDLEKKFPGYPNTNMVQYDLKMADFGMANLKKKLGLIKGGKGGKFPFKAPEQYKPKMYESYEPDLFSLGVIIYMLLTGEHPNKDFPDKRKALKHSQSGRPYEKWTLNNPSIRYSEDKEIEKLLNKLIQPDPANRAKLTETYDLFKRKLKSNNEYIYNVLMCRIDYYDLLDDKCSYENKLTSLIKVGKLPGFQESIIDDLLKQKQNIEKHLNTPYDVIKYCRVIEVILELYNSNHMSQDYLCSELIKLAKILKKWQDKIKPIHVFPEIKFKQQIIQKTPSIYDYESISDFIKLIIETLIKYKGIHFTMKIFRDLNNNFLSRFYFYLACKARCDYIFNSLVYIDIAKELNPKEKIFNEMAYNWIKSALNVDIVMHKYSQHSISILFKKLYDYK